MEERLKKLEEEMVLVKDRNKKVEANKAWETSKTRIVSILVLTYFIVAITLHFIGVPNIFLNAIIPTIGFFLSTQSFPFIKKWWISRNMK